jgi:GT2 family glycosyltransferase
MKKNNNAPKVSIVMRNKNRFSLTSECIKSLKKLTYPNFEIIVVDDASTDNSPKRLKKAFPHIILLQNKEYLGYCKGLNIGIHQALKNGADYVFLINNDTKDFSKNYLDEIIKIFTENDKIGLIGSKVVDFNGKEIWWGQVHKIHNRLGVNSNIPGCGFVVRSTVFEKIGLLDEGLFRFFEDLDFIIRLRKAGYKTAFTSSVKYAHLGGGTTSRVGFEFHYYRIRNIFIFLRRHGTRMSLLEKISRIIGLVSLHIIILVRCIIHGNLRNVFSIINAMLRGAITGLVLAYKG